MIISFLGRTSISRRVSESDKEACKLLGNFLNHVRSSNMAKKKASAPKTSLAKNERESHNESLSHRKISSKTKGPVVRNRAARREDDPPNQLARIWVSFGDASTDPQKSNKYSARVSAGSSITQRPKLDVFQFIATLQDAQGNIVAVADQTLGQITIEEDEDGNGKSGKIVIDFGDQESGIGTAEELELVIAYLTPKKVLVN
jgi:hypothetical protein